MERAIPVLAAAGFIYRQTAGITTFLDGPEAKARDAVPVLFAGRKVCEDYPAPVPTIDQFAMMSDARTLPLDRLVTMKLTSYRDKDRVHIRDMTSIGLIDSAWTKCYEGLLRDRLQELLDSPDG